MKQFLIFLFLAPFVSFAQHFGTTTLTVKSLPPLPAKIDSINQFLNKSPIYNSLDPTVQEWFYWTNYSRSNPKRFWDSVVLPILKTYPNLTNSYTGSLEQDLTVVSPLPLLKPNLKLLQTSQLLAQELADKNAPPSHTAPSGTTFQERMKNAGIITCAGENISFGQQNPVLMLVLLFIDSGVPQLGHRRSLLNSSFVEMGVGTAVYADKKSIVIQDFGCRQL